VIARHGQPALDVGCGTGRLLLDYLAQGIDIDGVDNSPEMLALCRDKAARMELSPRVFEQHMEDLHLPRVYGTVLVPSSSLQLVIEPDRVERALGRLRAHLQPGGVIAASVMTLWREGNPLESTHEKAAVRASDGITFRRVAWSRYDPSTECEETRVEYSKSANGEVIAREQHNRNPATRSYTQAQARSMFERAGFVNIQLLRAFSFEPAAPSDLVFCVLAHNQG
jgi:SAM-dependent methyltransferase